MTSGDIDSTSGLDDFEYVRSFTDDEVPAALATLSKNTQITQQLFARVPHAPDDEKVLDSLKLIRDIQGFQDWMRDFIKPLLDDTLSELSVSGLDQLKPSQNHIFISNHHDIVMDPLVINLALQDAGFETAHCAIGDNLLGTEAATTLAKLNKCFRVMRSLSSPKAMLRAMKIQSAYIHQLHFEQQAQIWIAQKEGRAKDNIDKTNPALIKMLCLAKPKHLSPNEYLATLNIVPVSISYEWDPCDLDKATQLEAEAQSSSYAKSQQDDLKAIEKGLFGQKGKIHVAFGSVVRTPDRNPLNRYEVANQIDHFIHSNYHCFGSNWVAAEKLNQNVDHEGLCEHISVAEKQEAERILHERLHACPEQIARRVLQAYAQPLSALNEARKKLA